MARQGHGPRLRQRRGAWIIRWTEGGRTRERRTSAGSRQEAETILADWLAGQRQRPRGLRRASDYLIADCLTDYLEEHGPEMASAARAGECVERLLDWWGDNAVSSVSKATCQGYTAHRRAAGRKDGTVRRELTVLSAAIGHAHASGRLTDRPQVWMPAPGAPKERWLTRSEAAALLRAARNEPKVRSYLPLFILMGLYTAARKGALLSLRWSQIDLERGLISLNPPGRKQTTKGRAKVPIPRRLMTFLKLAKKRGSDIGHVFTLDGQPIGDIKKAFNHAAIRAGLTVPMVDHKGQPILDKDGQPRIKHGVTPHTLRHTSATWMAQAGVSLWKVAGYLGQSIQRTTEMYAHHHPDHLRDAADALDGNSVTNSVTNRPRR